MDRLLHGIIKFKKEDYINHKDLFKKLANEQKPHTLFITCSDSRIDPGLITKTLPGELFTIRNIANIVPPYRNTSDYVSTTSAVEYAVEVLNVGNIIICGHSNCGGCAASLNMMDTINKLPHTNKWLELLEDIKEEIVLKYEDEEVRQWMLEQANVVEQMNNLMSYPYIKELVEDNKLKIMGWYYVIETGEIYEFNKEKKQFELLN